ncbi:MAG: metallopeptidase domain-containing protein [Planctomycetota bacterium]|jgi:M6 family metalloprotease-like protein
MNTFRSSACLLAAALVAALTGTLRAQELQAAGQVAVHSSATPFTTSTAAWHDVPGLKGGITLPKGGDLMVTVNADGRLSATTDQCFLRLLVDGQAAIPTSISFLRLQTVERSTTVNFYKLGIPAGTHQVRVQAFVSPGRATFGARSMIMRFCSATSPGIRMATAYRGNTQRAQGGYANVPGLVARINCPWPARLMICASGDFYAQLSTRRVFVRAVVDGKPSKDLVIERGASEGCRSVTLTSGAVAKGNRTVTLQWLAEGTAGFRSANLIVVAIHDQINYKSGYLHQSATSGGTILTRSTTFAGVPGASGGYVWVPSRCDLAIRFSAEVGADPGSQFRLLARVGSSFTPHGRTNLMTGRGTVETANREKLWVFRNVERGYHYVTLQWATDKGAIVMGDRTLTVTAVSGQRPLLVTATESKRPASYKYGGLFASSVVNTVGGKRFFKPYVADNLFRKKPGVADWFSENSRGHMYVVQAAVIGPNMKLFDEPSYRALPNAFTAMKVEALTYADDAFDFSYYDRNGDGFVRTDELYGLVIFYQDTNFGEVRSIPTIQTRDGVTLDYRSGVATVYTSDFKKQQELGVMNHELSHLLLNAGDMYETKVDPTAPGPFSIMDQYGWNGHLDPLHKLKGGKWYEAYAQTKDRWLTLTPVSQGGSLVKLYDPNSHKGEYFLVENRAWRGYNASLPTAGLAVWHCDENRLPNWRTAVEIEPACGPINPINYRNYLFTGKEFGFHKNKDLWSSSSHSNTRWHDNMPSNLGLWAIEAVGDGSGNIRMFVDTPGPGVLIQFEDRTPNLDGSGSANTRVRIVNTSTYKDTFQIRVNIQGDASWRSRFVTLQPYEQRVYALALRPWSSAKTSATVTATGTSVSNTDTASIRYTLLATGTGNIGRTVTLSMNNPKHAGEAYFMGAAVGDIPGFKLPGGMHVPLNSDVLLNSYFTMPTIFRNFFGRLHPQTGKGTAYVDVPYEPGLRGIRVYCAYVTGDATRGVYTSTSNGVSFLIK